MGTGCKYRLVQRYCRNAGNGPTLKTLRHFQTLADAIDHLVDVTGCGKCTLLRRCGCGHALIAECGLNGPHVIWIGRDPVRSSSSAVLWIARENDFVSDDQENFRRISPIALQEQMPNVYRKYSHLCTVSRLNRRSQFRKQNYLRACENGTDNNRPFASTGRTWNCTWFRSKRSMRARLFYFVKNYPAVVEPRVLFPEENSTTFHYLE